jgi:BlaR1 peptidase M56
MFYALGFCLFFAVMFLVMAVAAAASIPAIRFVRINAGRFRASTIAGLLFALRSFPPALGALISFGLVLPAFLEFEPHSTGEMPGAALLFLAALGLVTLCAMGWRCWRIVNATLKLERRWLEHASLLPIRMKGVPVYRVGESASLLAVTGILSPRIFVSGNVAAALSGPELEAALAHELAHVSASDNLKQFLLKIARPPRWLRPLVQADSLWTNTSELAADERAIAEGASALELSSALVKVGRLSANGHRAPLLAASHLVDGCGSATLARATRLHAFLEHGTAPEHSARSAHERYRWHICVGALLLIYLSLLATMLPKMHEALEFLVR